MSKRTLTTSPEEWKSRLADVPVSKDDLNLLVANYLFTEGFRDTAENFSREAGIAPAIDLDSIENRMIIRRAVQRGDVEEATRLVNDLDPELLDHNPTLHFQLLQLQLIELIRQQRILDALTFAQSSLAPRGEENPEFLSELERTMALLAFELPSSPSTTDGIEMPKSLSSLLDQSQRLMIAKELNKAILNSQSHCKEPKLPGMLKMLAWGEGLLGEKGAEFPRWEFHQLLRNQAATSTAGGDSEMIL